MKLSWPKYEIFKEINGEKVLYLRRYFIWRCKWFNIFLHYIPIADQDKTITGFDASHNHPWNFVGILLNGGYDEGLFNSWNKKEIIKRRAFSCSAFGLRKAKQYHKILSVLPNTWSIIITGQSINHWSFWVDDGNIVPFEKFLNIPVDTEMD